MKVFFYSHTLCPGGAEKQCALMASAIKKRFGYDSVVLLNWGAGAKPEFLEYLKEVGAGLEVLPCNPFLRLARLHSIFKRNRDAVLFNYLTYPDVVGALVARLAGLKRVVGGFETDRMFGLKMLAERISHHYFSACTIVNSYRAFDFCASRGFDKSRMIVMPSAIELSRIAEKSKNRDSGSKIRVICTGRFVPEKDYRTWVDVVACVWEQCKNIDPVIIGYGDLEGDIREYIALKGLDSVIRILPGRSANVRVELSESDIYLSTSVQEGTSNTILEAMDACLPIVTTDVGDNSRMVEHGRSGFVCKPKDIPSLVTAVLNLANDRDLRRLYGARSRAIVERKYSVEKLSQEYDILIKKLEKQR